MNKLNKAIDRAVSQCKSFELMSNTNQPVGGRDFYRMMSYILESMKEPTEQGNPDYKRIDELERRVADLESEVFGKVTSECPEEADCPECRKKDAPAVELPPNWGKIKDENGNLVDFKTMQGECNHDFMGGACCIYCGSTEPATPSEPSKDDGQTPREVALKIAELLWSIGWNSPNDAQTKRLENTLEEIKAVLLCVNDQKDKVAISREVADRWIQGKIGSMADMQDEIRKALGEK